jgi:DNA mismatch endonuclease (patch repair protein)
LRFRKDALVSAGEVRVRVDILFRRARVAVFVDGCFWHRCPTHGSQPRSNSEYWLRKLSANAERDARVNAALSNEGWTVVRAWEHESPSMLADRIAGLLDGDGA